MEVGGWENSSGEVQVGWRGVAQRVWGKLLVGAELWKEELPHVVVTSPGRTILQPQSFKSHGVGIDGQVRSLYHNYLFI